MAVPAPFPVARCYQELLQKYGFAYSYIQVRGERWFREASRRLLRPAARTIS
jgi:hypothetical protein